jgi:hypothetical protein
MNAEEIARELGRASRSGNGWKCLCPAHDDTNPSLSIWDTPADGGVAFNCYAGCNWLVVKDALKARGLREPWRAEAKAARSPFHLSGFGDPAHVYEYRDCDGKVVFQVARYETPSGKQLRPWTRGADGKLTCKGARAPLPLYQLPELLAHPERPVLVVEGEKCVQAASELLGDAYVVITWSGGVGQVAKTDYEPLHGRTIVFWPDADEPGVSAMQYIAGKLGNGRTQAKMLDVGERPAGWDVADAIAVGWSASEVQTFLEEHAQPVGVAPEDGSTAPDEKRAPRFRCVPLSEIIATRGEWTIKGLLPRHGIGSIFGEYSCGKSFLAFDIAATIARGVDNWRGYRVKARGGAIYIAAEGAGGAGNRVSAYTKHHGIGVAEIALEYVMARIDLRTPGAMLEELVAAIREAEARMAKKVVLIVVDTLARTMPGGSDSKAEDMSAYVENCVTLGAALNAFVLIVHHAGKDASKGSRGSTVLPGAVDVEVVALGEDADGDPVTSCVVVSADASFATPKKKNLNGTANTAIKALRESIEAHGETMPETSTIPRGVRATTLGRWREQFALRYGRDGKTGREPETVDRAFRRGKEDLLKHSLICISDPHVWVWS